MKEAATTQLNSRLVHAKAMRFVGLRRHCSGQDMDQVPAQWQAFIAQRQNIPRERYGEKFVPRTGTGDIEIWIPIEA